MSKQYKKNTCKRKIQGKREELKKQGKKKQSSPMLFSYPPIHMKPASRCSPRQEPSSQSPVAAAAVAVAVGCADSASRRTVVVGIRRDAASMELLTWALVRAANAGDRVVALHVATASTAAVSDDGELELERKIKVADSLVSVLQVFDGFCNLKQINLELKVCEGSSIRKTLVKEASTYGATYLILGVTKNSRPFRGCSAAIAKYCAKRVPQNCSVLAVNNGKIVYHRDAFQQESYHFTKALVETPRRSYGKIIGAKVMIGERARDDSVMDNRSISRSVAMPISAPLSPKDASLALVPVKSCTVELPEVAIGWPLGRKDFMLNRKPDLLDWSEMSVVQWAMQLPDRYSAVSPLHAEHKTAELDFTAISDQILRGRAVVPFKNSTAKPSPVIEELISLEEKYSSMYTLFSYSELARITSDFSPECIVGTGGTSRVYRGVLANGKEVAVKVLKSSDEILKEFISEIEIISSLDDKNIVSLVGFCFEDGHLMLVYDYLQRGSLEEMMHGEKESKNGFGWTERFKVAVGVAHALAHLHGGRNHRPAIHRDVKSSNILISNDFEAKLCDFGLALWAADVTSEITGHDVAGTFGYLAPEYFMHGKVSEKIDVYAFGVILLELISGRKPVCSGCPKGEESLVMWANSVIQGGKLTQLVDPGRLIDSDAGEIERMTLAASLCIRREPQRRPSMAVILELLCGDDNVLGWARSQVRAEDESDSNHSEVVPPERSNIQSYINLALLDVEDDTTSVSSSTDFVGANMSLEEYLRGRWSRSSSFN